MWDDDAWTIYWATEQTPLLGDARRSPGIGHLGGKLPRKKGRESEQPSEVARLGRVPRQAQLPSELTPRLPCQGSPVNPVRGRKLGPRRLVRPVAAPDPAAGKPIVTSLVLQVLQHGERARVGGGTLGRSL